MSGGYGYDDRAIYPRGGNGYTDNRLALHDVAEDSFRHTASGGVCHHSGSVTPGGDMHHSYGCCRESAWMHGIGQRETDSPMTKDYVRRSVIANAKTKISRDLMPPNLSGITAKSILSTEASIVDHSGAKYTQR